MSGGEKCDYILFSTVYFTIQIIVTTYEGQSYSGLKVGKLRRLRGVEGSR